MPFVFLGVIVLSTVLSMGIVVFGTEDLRQHGLRMEEQGYSRGVQDMAKFMTTDIKLAYECLNERKQEAGDGVH